MCAQAGHIKVNTMANDEMRLCAWTNVGRRRHDSRPEMRAMNSKQNRTHGIGSEFDLILAGIRLGRVRVRYEENDQEESRGEGARHGLDLVV